MQQHALSPRPEPGVAIEHAHSADGFAPRVVVSGGHDSPYMTFMSAPCTRRF